MSRLPRNPNGEAVEWESYPRVLPGEYMALCYWGKRYRDPGFNRWTCLLRWDVLSEGGSGKLTKIPLGMFLGKASKRLRLHSINHRSQIRPTG